MNSALALVLFASQLIFDNGAIHANVTWLKGPVKAPQESRLQVEWRDGANTAIAAPGPFEVELFMPQHGHGSTPTEVNQIVDGSGRPVLGSYEVSKMYFTMNGKWEVRVKVTYPNNTTEEQKFTVDLGGHGH